MRRLNPNLYPKDGFWFKDSDGVDHRADTWPGVIARVVKYRQRAGHPPGNPAVEVIEQACQRNAGLCHEETGSPSQDLQKASLKSRVLAWLTYAREEKTKGLIEYVDAQTAAARAQVCAGCPMNQPLQESCSSCRAALDELRKDILGRRTLDKRLNGCLLLGEDMQTAAHLERVTMENGELPGCCWRRRTPP